MQTVVELPSYLAAAKAAGLSEDERREIVDIVAVDPLIGDVMQGTGGCRKFRLAGRGKGKSGGYRIVFIFGGDQIPVFLLAVFGKDRKDNLSKAERGELAKLTRLLFDTYGKTQR
ncbi:MAG: type II toxin-antitoxin system RelE/ParE family toxin [Rhizobiales bacterium]|nr:type II toxin-antitoxin system RelE/ParE family toxin [Hyphomicrobiales bacterium]